MVVARGGSEGGVEEWVKWVKKIKTYKLPVVKLISRGGVMYSMVTVLSNTVLYV